MKNFFQLFCALCVFTFGCAYLQAQDAPVVEAVEITEPATPAVPVGPTTEITFTETTFDFGTVQEGEIISHTYTFTNTGNETLILSDARGSCGCTVPQWPREPIAPGETASITVEFNSKNKKGKRNQKVTIKANTVVPQTFLYLTGEIVPNDAIGIEFADPIEFTGSSPEVPVAPAKSAFSPDCLVVYPNPTAEFIRLDLKDNIGDAATVSIYSQTGQLMAERRIDRIEGQIEFQVGHYPPGNYIANVILDDTAAQSRCFVVME